MQDRAVFYQNKVHSFGPLYAKITKDAGKFAQFGRHSAPVVNGISLKLMVYRVVQQVYVVVTPDSVIIHYTMCTGLSWSQDPVK